MNLKGKSLLVFGSRTLDDGRIEEALATFVEQNNFKIIVTALDPKGVCDRVKRYAKMCQNGITLIQIGLDKSRARGMHEYRSMKALELADHMLAIYAFEVRYQIPVVWAGTEANAAALIERWAFWYAREVKNSWFRPFMMPEQAARWIHICRPIWRDCGGISRAISQCRKNMFNDA